MAGIVDVEEHLFLNLILCYLSFDARDKYLDILTFEI